MNDRDRDEIIMSLSEIADQPTEDGIVDGVNQQTIKGALELLKEREPVEPNVEPAIVPAFKVYSCGHCDTAFLQWRPKYCSNCGRKVKWDD